MNAKYIARNGAIALAAPCILERSEADDEGAS